MKPCTAGAANAWQDTPMLFQQPRLRFLVTVVLTASVLSMSALRAASGTASSRQKPDREPAGQGGEPLHEKRHVDALRMVIEKSFRRCDAGRLRPAFSREVKTYVALPALGVPDGYYGADQMLLLLQRMFEGRSTVRFSINRPRARIRKDGRAVLAAKWVYRDGAVTRAELRISFVLAAEGPHWRIREIRRLK